MKINPPKSGFSRGTIHGLLVALPLLFLLIGLAFLTDVQPRSADAVALDLLLAMCVSVMAVWVVGGLFEFEGKLFDISIKGAGGVAVILFLVVWVRPFYAVANPGDYVAAELPAGAPLSFMLDEINDRYRQGTSDIFVKYEDGHVRRYRPKPVEAVIKFQGGTWEQVLKRLDREAKCFNVTLEDDAIILGLDRKQADFVNQEPTPLFTC